MLASKATKGSNDNKENEEGNACGHINWALTRVSQILHIDIKRKAHMSERKLLLGGKQLFVVCDVLVELVKLEVIKLAK